jgi:hypothetical protein
MSLVDDYTARADALAVLRGLIDLLSDPKATRKQLDTLEQAHIRANEERAAVIKLKAEQEQIRAQMADEAEAHRRALSDERLRLNNEINARKNELAKAEAAVNAAKETAETDARQAVELRARWQKKVDAIDAGLRA